MNNPHEVPEQRYPVRERSEKIYINSLNCEILIVNILAEGLFVFSYR